MNSIKQILQEARDLISEPDSWTTKVAARDADGNSTDVAGENVVCWCSLAALEAIAIQHQEKDGSRLALDGVDLYEKASTTLEKCMNGDVIAFNDNNTHTNVLWAFDKAIASLEEEA